MADLKFIQTYPETACGVALKTLLQLAAPTNQRLRLWEVGLSFKGVTAADAPILVELLLQTTAGTMSANNPAAEDSSLPEAIQTTGQRDATVEPAAGTVLRAWEVHPQGGSILWQAASERDTIPVGGGKRVGLRVVTPGVSVSCRGYIRGEE